MNQKILLLITSLLFALPIIAAPKRRGLKTSLKIRLPRKQNYNQNAMLVGKDTSNSSLDTERNDTSSISKKRTFEDDYEEEDSKIIHESSSKKRPLGDDHEQEEAVMSEDAIEKLCTSFKKVEITTRKKEEDRRDEEYRNLITQRFALNDKEQQARYIDTPEIIAERARLNQAFELYAIKAKQLRDEINPAMDLTNNDWDKDPYWK